MSRLRLCLAACALLLAAAAVAQPAATVSAQPADSLDAMRRGVPLDKDAAPPPLASTENKDVRRNRAYPMQPPTIPHSIENYQLDRNYNRCLMCHTRANAPKFQAPMVSVTHYMDRDDNFLAEISPRRYFCTQCHVEQTDAKPPVGSRFEDIDSILKNEVKKH